VSVPALQACHTQAKSLDELMSRVREAIELCSEVEGEPDAEPHRQGTHWVPKAVGVQAGPCSRQVTTSCVIRTDVEPWCPCMPEKRLALVCFRRFSGMLRSARMS